MNELKNGIFYIDGEPTIALGTQYYPSFHPQKVPVPPQGDRLAELRLDLEQIRQAGYQIVRTAALGELKREADGTVSATLPLVDEIVRACEAQDLGVFVRLQGYDVNLGNFDDADMLDENGRPMKPFWGWFVRNCLNHPGVLKDNEDAAVACAAHFQAFSNVLGFQIYNEPGYPTEGFFDYNPHTVAAWRESLVCEGKATAEQVATLRPPKQRPDAGQDEALWCSWRLFQYRRMNDYLNHLAQKAKEGYAKPETFTCMTAGAVQQGGILRGADYFRSAKEMDILGITHYLPFAGGTYFEATKVLDAAESAAAAFGKHAWLIEYNAHTALSANALVRETYAALGSGIKGILYYQWRADYPYTDAPEPEGFGMVYNDRTPTQKYDAALAINRMIAAYGRQLVKMEKHRVGVAILFSENANAYCDAVDNGRDTSTWSGRERSYLNASALYRALRAMQLPVEFVRAAELKDNLIGCSLLLVPTKAGLSAEETAQIRRFVLQGNTAAVYNAHLCALELLYAPQDEMLTLEELLERTDIQPPLQSNAPTLDARVLQGADGYAVFLMNYSAQDRPIPAGHTLTLRLPKVSEQWNAALVTPYSNTKLPLKESGAEVRLTLPELTAGAMLLLEPRQAVAAN